MLPFSIIERNNFADMSENLAINVNLKIILSNRNICAKNSSMMSNVAEKCNILATSLIVP